MNWYNGNIAEAVALSKTKNAIFVVYVEGKDEATTKLTNFINDTRVREKLESDDFVAIKIQGESEAYMQFASIFQIVPVPSIFFIGKAGTPLDIATGVLASVEELEGKISKVLQLAGKVSAASSTAAAAINEFIREETKASTSKEEEDKKVETKKEEVKTEDMKKEEVKTEEVKKEETKVVNKESEEEIVCKDGISFKKPKESSKEEEKKAEEPSTQTQQEDEDKLAETRKYLEQKRRERIEEEKRLEKERELRRRKEGKEIQNLRAWQKDQELKELKENIKRERLEEQAARERIRAQIAADKAERAHKFAADTQATTSNQTANNANTTKTPNATATDESRLQFRLASGASNSQNFKCSTTLSEIREYVIRELLPGTGIKEFTLATTYPKRELTDEHNTKTLLELELFPSAVILIIGKEATGPTAIISRNGGLLNMITILLMTILNPIFSIFTSAKNWLTGKGKENANGGASGGNAQTGAQKRANEDENDVSKRRNLDRFLSGGGSGNTTGTSNPDDSSPGSSGQGGAYRRYLGGSNIHRLSDNRKDSDDENATWNGNSTQQQ